MNLIKEQISTMIQEVHDGNESACYVHSLLKDIEKTVESGLKTIKEGALIEAREFDKDGVYHGGTWQIRATQTYLFLEQDPVYVQLKESLSSREQDLKNAWKAKQSNKGFFDSETGEEIPVLAVKKPAGESVVFKPEKS